MEEQPTNMLQFASSNSSPPAVFHHRSRFTYKCDEGDVQALASVHRVSVKHNKDPTLSHRFFTPIFLILLLLRIFYSALVIKGISGWECMFLMSILILRVSRRNEVIEEVVVLMPRLGVQLETSYRSGKVMRRFLPMEKILAAVINEAVSPITCYFYLALLVREKPDLTLVFLKLRPPLDILIPIWKAFNDVVTPKPSNHPSME